MARDDDDDDDAEEEKPAKWTRRDIGHRLEDFVESRLAAFRSYSQVLDDAAEWGLENFGVAPNWRTVARAIAEVRKRWVMAERETVEQRRAGFRAQIHEYIKRAEASGDYRAVAVMLRTLADVEGVKAPKRVEHGGTVRHVAAMTVGERDAEIQALLEKRAAAKGQIAPPAIALLGVGGEEDDELTRELERLAQARPVPVVVEKPKAKRKRKDEPPGN